jgi:peptidoglycan/LPS O-acetylase OafA/YrhL
MKRQLSLDLLRGIAVLLVIVCHCHVTEPILATIKRGGWIGVDLFFVLSGFLVSGLLFKQHAKEGRIRPIQFLIRRGFKIYPAFWVFIAFTVLSFDVTHGHIPWDKMTGELLFLQSYTKTRMNEGPALKLRDALMQPQQQSRQAPSLASLQLQPNVG